MTVLFYLYKTKIIIYYLFNEILMLFTSKSIFDKPIYFHYNNLLNSEILKFVLQYFKIENHNYNKLSYDYKS